MAIECKQLYCVKFRPNATFTKGTQQQYAVESWELLIDELKGLGYLPDIISIELVDTEVHVITSETAALNL